MDLLRRGRHLILWTALGAAAGLLGLSLIPTLEKRIGPAAIAASARLGEGRTVISFPPLGTVTADTHSSPLILALSVVEVDLPSLGHDLVDSQSRGALAAQIEADLRSLANRVALQLIVGAAALGAIVGAALPGRTWARVLSASLGGAIAVGALIALAGVSYKLDAFAQPRFTGTLRRAPVVLEAVRAGEITLRDVRSRYRNAAERLSDLLAVVAKDERRATPGDVAILHISDIHSNPLGLELARELARRFRVDAVLDTGDIASYGLPVETAIGNFVEGFDVPYIFVPGNHDSALVQRAMSKVDNVVLLGGGMTEVGGVEIFGWADPTYTNWNKIPVAEANRIRIEEGAVVAEAVGRAAPDILAVHDKRLAQASYGNVPLVLAGHDHERVIEEHEGTLVLAVGSTGATGIKGFTVETQRPYEAQIVYFNEDRATAVDYIRFSGSGNDFEVDRTTFDA